MSKSQSKQRVNTPKRNGVTPKEGERERDEELMRKYKVKKSDFYDLKEAFVLFDKNGDGTITSAEVGHVFRATGQNPSNKEIEEFVRELDVIDVNGTVSFEEFIRGVGPNFKLKSEAEMIGELQEAFAVFDKNGDGYLNVKELKSAMTLLGEKVTDQEAEDMLSVADTDGDHKLNYIEFAKRMAAK